jgi:predicted RNase H-like HicB family nuclease
VKHRYEIVLYWSDEDRIFIAEVPDLPGCMAHGRSREKALANVQDAIRLWIEVARDTGRRVPEPKGKRVSRA